MLDTGETEELRALQKRAYGRGGRLSEVEAERLHTLVSKRSPAPGAATESGAQGETAPDSGGGSSVGARNQEGAGWPRTSAATTTATGAHDGAATPVETSPSAPVAAPRTWPSLLREHAKLVAAASALLLVIGVGVGWMLFRTPEFSITLSPEQQDFQAALIADGKYDQGSVRALAADEGVTVWWATIDDGERVCLVVTAKELTRPHCQPRDNVSERGLFASVSIPEGKMQREVGVQMLLGFDGEPAVIMNSMLIDPESNGMIYANEEEATFAADMVEKGFHQNSVWVVGSEGDVPFWTGTREAETCLMRGLDAAAVEMVCGDSDELWSGKQALVLDYPDAKTDAVHQAELSFGSGPQRLMITKNGGSGDVDQ